MGKPLPTWWADVKAAIRRYPEMDKAVKADVPTAQIAQYGHVTRKNGAGRPVESYAIKNQSHNSLTEYDAIKRAIRDTASRGNGESRLAVVNLVFWSGNMSVPEAGEAVGYSEKQASRFISDFVYLTAFHMGLVDAKELRNRS